MTITLDCGHPPTPNSGYGTGYGTDEHGRRHCYACCARNDRASMTATGKAVLYLADDEVTNWPGTLRFRIGGRQVGAHNIARTQTHFWFLGPDDLWWHGVQFGSMSMLARCRRLKIQP